MHGDVCAASTALEAPAGPPAGSLGPSWGVAAGPPNTQGPPHPARCLPPALPGSVSGLVTVPPPSPGSPDLRMLFSLLELL